MSENDRLFGENALGFVALQVAELETSVGGWLELIADDVPAGVSLLADIREQRQRLALVEAAVESHVARAMTGDRFEGSGVVAERKGGNTYRRWDTGRVLSRVIDRMLQSSDGEVPDPWQVRDEITAIFRLDPRVRALKQRDIDFSDAVEVERGRRTVHIVRSDETAVES